MQDSAAGFSEFAAARSGSLFRTALLLTGGDWHLAEDLVQETLGKMYGRWRRILPDDPAAYARTVLVRTFLSHRRKRSSWEQSTAALPERPTRDGDADLRITLLDGLAKLAAKDRAVLVLRYWEDRSVEQTASELGLSPGAVRSRSFRALDRLRDVLDGTYSDLSALGR